MLLGLSTPAAEPPGTRPQRGMIFWGVKEGVKEVVRSSFLLYL